MCSCTTRCGRTYPVTLYVPGVQDYGVDMSPVMLRVDVSFDCAPSGFVNWVCHWAKEIALINMFRPRPYIAVQLLV